MADGTLHRSAPLRRGAPLRPSPPLTRRTPIKRVNKARRARLFARNYGERGGLVRAMPCTCAPSGTCRGRVHAAHVEARGMGGVKGDRRSLVPLCAGHHDELHRRGLAAFAAIYGVDLHAIAGSIARLFDADGVA